MEDKDIVKVEEDKDIVKTEDSEDELIQKNYDAFIERTKNTWDLSKKAQKAVSATMTMVSTKHGLFAQIPIICKAKGCPYAETCAILKNDLAPFGEQCPVEIAKIFTLSVKYTDELEIDDDDNVDRGLLKELINCELMLDRCNARVASEGDFIQMVAFAATEDGTVLERPELSKTVEFRDKVEKKKHEILQLLNSTRKDKVGNNMNLNFTPTQIVEDLMAKAKEFDKVVEVDYEVNDNKENNKEEVKE